jgi:hypothetical protein
VSLVQSLEQCSQRQYRSATAPGCAPGSARVAALLRHEMRLWGLINALWGEVCAPA